MKTLISKLNPTCRKTLELASSLCVSHGHYNVEIDHFLLKMLEISDSDVRAILKYYEIDIQSIIKYVQFSIERISGGSTSAPVFSKHIEMMLEQAWLASSLRLDQQMIRSGSILFSLIDVDTLRGVLLDTCPLLLRISRLSLRNDIYDILKLSRENNAPDDTALRPNIITQSPLSLSERSAFFDSLQTDAAKETSVLSSVLAPTLESSLAKYTINLTKKAQQDELDPIFGRDVEINQMIDVLMRRRQNNPILVGESGVGKTAIIEGFAQKIISGSVPPLLSMVQIHSLDLGMLFSGASFRGELEQRLKRLIAEVAESLYPIILFIDEAHMLIGSSHGAAMGDLSNLLKPVLARGQMRIIAATTWSEYKRFFEKDAAFSRRFEKVKVQEPHAASAIEMLRVSVPLLQRHHNIHVLNEALEAAVYLSQRFLTERRLPDKAICVLDTACAQISLSRHSCPKALQDILSKQNILNLEKKLLLDECSLEHLKIKQPIRRRIKEIDLSLESLEKTRLEIHKEWQEQKELLKELGCLRDELKNAEEEKDKKLQNRILVKIKTIKNKLTERPSLIIKSIVDQEAIAQVISEWTGIPKTTILSQSTGWTEDSLKEELKKRIVGQSFSLKTITRVILQYQTGLNDETKPIGVFFLVGPSGVGKTETALALADVLMGNANHLIRLNMNEFQEPHTMATLKGAPPGYVGYGRGGTLTEAVRQNPYSVILMDEVDKAHPDVLNLFYQIFDKGVLEDSEGVEVDFSHTLFILTSNDCLNLITERCRIIKDTEDAQLIFDQLAQKSTQEVSETYGTAFIGRTLVIPYLTLKHDDVCIIINNKMKKIEERLLAKHRVKIEDVSPILQKAISSFLEKAQGARAIDHYLNQHVLPELTRFLQTRLQATQEEDEVCELPAIEPTSRPKKVIEFSKKA